MRLILIAALTSLLLSSCTALQPRPDRSEHLSFICIPGSAIKRKVPAAAAYPAWMTRERGSCLHS
ncbi:MAG: hypothetical protein HKO64_06055 [Xanthomonadales bacterium]|nr:hypothetical protein [Gammaproteobacteria bacterium]NNE05392.1 hypothetical protein [Xanthomonadales bacterium]NNL95167.1 hypothetical protein [Xanthomonadales bacterium]